MVREVALRRIHSGLRALIACLVFAGMVCSIVSPAFAAGGQTGQITATVVDNVTKQPIAGATVSAASPTGSYSATTAANGTFSIIGMNVDTYTISVSKPGYDTFVLTGATVTGDQTLQLTLPVSKASAVIGRVNARSASGAFQPNQTVDSYTISGSRLQQTTGSPADTNLNDVILSAPGVQLTNTGVPTIRGGSLREVGYQFDGINFKEPFLGDNGGAGLFNGLGSVQVVEGVGDASQGGLGAGVINVIPKRGTYPAAGNITLQAGGPNFSNIAQADYGFANRDGTISNYFSISNDRHAPYYGFHNQDAASYGNYFGVSMVNNTQILDNFVFKFGKDHSQSLQVLYSNLAQFQHGNLGGVVPGTYDAATNPFGLSYYPYDPFAEGGGQTYATSPYATINPTPGIPSSNIAPGGPELIKQINTRFLKVEYDNNLDANTFLAIRYYNWERLQQDQNLYSQSYTNAGVALWEQEGGPTTGVNFDLSHQFGDKLNVELDGDYEVVHPIWNQILPIYATFGALYGDFLPPTAGCPVTGQGMGYVTCAYGNGVVPAPSLYINMNGTYFQNFGAGIRFQYAITPKLHTDFGVRWEGQNQDFNNPANPNNIGNPFDVPPQLWTPQVTNPKVISPRIALSYQFDANDALRLSYGRSAVFQVAQNAGTPFGLYGNLAALKALPPNTAGLTPAQIATQCGNSAATDNLVGSVPFPCQNYYQQLFWSYDAGGFDAPDAGGVQPSIYTNYDASLSHQFSNGMAIKLTPFYKNATSLPTASLLLTLPDGSQVFSGASKGVNRTTGGEFSFTTPDRAVGFSGFISGTYQNVLQSAPPLSNGEFDGVPQLSPADIALGNVYRAGYIAPVSVRIGGTYNFKGGFSITPTLQIDSGFPYNVGDTIASTLADGSFANIPQVNFGPGAPILIGLLNQRGTSLSTNYADPAYSGSQLAPNIDATRGTPTSSHSGGITWTPNVQLNVTLQYKHGRDTFGLQMVNVGTNGYNNTTPAVNPFYQPVGNGTSGPQTGQNTCTATYGAARGCAAIQPNSYAFSNGAYLLTNGNDDGYQIAPLAPMSFNLFYRRQI